MRIQSRRRWSPRSTLREPAPLNILYSKGICESYELPNWYQGYRYVRGGYRVGYCQCDCIRSLAAIHNETCNIWSHLLGALLFAGRGILTIGHLLYFFSMSQDLRNILWADEIAALAFILSAALMFSLSAGYHTMHPVSPELCIFWRKLDFVGIAFMITGSVVCGIWLGFKCEPLGIRLFWLVAFILSAIAAAFISLYTISINNGDDSAEEMISLPKNFCCAPWWYCLWQQAKLQKIKTWLPFLILGLTCFAPAVHWIFVAPQIMRIILAPGLGVMAFFYILGLFFYFSHWPERLAPGRFDHFGASHQLWHLCILLAALAWLLNTDLALALIRQQYESTQPPHLYTAIFDLPLPHSFDQFVSTFSKDKSAAHFFALGALCGNNKRRMNFFFSQEVSSSNITSQVNK
uniref:Uncharacterized protein n=1 Tax=Aureoumbra lagunensis TaxID=44058 RepID=A0A7S3NJT5_9STRA